MKETIKLIINKIYNHCPEFCKSSYIINILNGIEEAKMYKDKTFSYGDGMFATFPNAKLSQIQKSVKELAKENFCVVKGDFIEPIQQMDLDAIEKEIKKTKLEIVELHNLILNKEDQLSELEKKKKDLLKKKAVAVLTTNSQWLIGKCNPEWDVKKYTIEEFQKIPGIKNEKTIFGELKSSNNKIKILDKTFFCDSKTECNFIEKLKKEGLAIAISGQSPLIKYKSMSNNLKNYLPDFILLTKDYEVIVVEIKDRLNMSYHQHIEKYHALKKYCKKNGFKYIMTDCDANGILFSYDDLMNYDVSPKMETAFKKWKDESLKLTYNFFKEKDAKNWLEKNELSTQDKLMLEKLIIDNWCFNTNKHFGFNVYSRGVVLGDGFKPIEFAPKFEKWFD